jgi:hypothetical protein
VKLGKIANQYAREVDRLIMGFFIHKGLKANDKTFKKLTRLLIKRGGTRSNYYYDGKLIITIYPYNKETLVMDYKLHYLEKGE